MSTFGGIYNFDGTEVDEHLLIAMGDALLKRGPDGGNEIRFDSLGMVYRAFHTNSESRQEHQPLMTRDGVALCWDGRLDNRAELVALLRHDLNGDESDVSIVLGCFRRWQNDFLSKILGDFALSLWDPRKKTMLLARDLAGPRPLFYHTDKRRIIWSSELTCLLDLADLSLKVDDDYVAGYLTGDPDPGLTPYKDIFAVPPAHVVSARLGQVSVKRFWKLEPSQEIVYKTDSEYEDHFRYLFRDAVRCRLRVDGPVWAQLSGGLDSSAIVCMADDLLKGGQQQATKLRTVSHLYGESRTSDEGAFIAAVEKKTGLSNCHLLEEDCPPLSSFPDQLELDFPDFLDCFVSRNRALSEGMHQDGARVLLTGHGGDQLLCSTETAAPEIADLLFKLQPIKLHRCLKNWRSSLKKPYFQLLREAVALILPRTLSVARVLDQNVRLPSWFNTRFVEKRNLWALSRGPEDAFGFKLPSKRDQVKWFLAAVSFISWPAYRERVCIEVSHPYLHRPLVEFLHAIPFTQMVRPHEARSIMRRALSYLLPEEITMRRSKRGPEEALFRALVREWTRLEPLMSNARVCARGYMDQKALTMAFQRARHGGERFSFALIKTISLEFWLRALEQRRSVIKRPVVCHRQGRCA